MVCSRIVEDSEVISSVGCAACGSKKFQVLRKGAFGNSLPLLNRAKSLEASELLDTSRRIARQALNAVNGDFNAACRNLLFNLLAPNNPPFFDLAKSTEKELAEFAGVSREEARKLLAENNNDVRVCKCKLLQSIMQESDDWDLEGRARQAVPRIQQNAQEATCSVCYCAIEPGGMLILRSCQHQFCYECIQGHVHASMNSGKNLIHCMAQQCKCEFSQDELREVMGEQVFSKLERRALEAVVAMDPTLHHCPTPDCSYVVAWSGYEDGAPLCDCPTCGKNSCLVCCQSPYHTGLTCDQYKATVEQNVNEENERLTEEYLKRSTIRKCRRCGNGVVKASGCLKMKCRCGYRFCFQCGSENAQCGHTPASHGFINNRGGGADFSNLKHSVSPT